MVKNRSKKNNLKQRKQITGVVVSNAMEKTVVVKTTRLKKHPLYKKRYYLDKNIQAHESTGKIKVGDRVIIEETAPISKNKKFNVVKKIS
jgi:small subunit ribosomal protein S17